MSEEKSEKGKKEKKEVSAMEEHFILRVPPSVAERLNRLLDGDPTMAAENSIDLSFQDDGRTGNFVIGKDEFPAALLDLPTVVESYKTYDDSVLIKAADVGQIIMVQEPHEAAPAGPEYKDGLTKPMQDARSRRFRQEPDLSPDFINKVQEIEDKLQNIKKGKFHVEVVEEEVDADDDGEPAEASGAAAASSSAADQGSKPTPSKEADPGNGTARETAAAKEHQGEKTPQIDDGTMDEV